MASLKDKKFKSPISEEAKNNSLLSGYNKSDAIGKATDLAKSIGITKTSSAGILNLVREATDLER